MRRLTAVCIQRLIATRSYSCRSRIHADGALPLHSPNPYARRSAYCHGFQARPFSSSSFFSSEPSPPLKYFSYAAFLAGCGLLTYYYFPKPPAQKNASPEEHVLTNWSGTHEARTTVYLQPETLAELEAAVKNAHAKKQKLRPVGSGLSPNGIGLSDEGMVNLALMDQILHVDNETNRVTVQAGARVEQVVEALKPYGLTLQNFASIKEQQIGGFIQVGAHGTGATLPPVDEQVVSLKLVTPAKGTLELSAENDPELFYLSRCGLGALGIVAEVTLQCVPREKLLEYTFVTNMKQVKKNHKKWLQENKHLRYMWIPDTDTIVVVQCNPLADGKEPPKFRYKYTREERLQPVRALYDELCSKYRVATKNSTEKHENATELPPPAEAGTWSGTAAGSWEPLGSLLDEDLLDLSFTELRDKLLALDPLNRENVIKINKIEAEYWKRSEGYRLGWSDEILGFDCGGQQWVSEVCFPVGNLKKPNYNDLKYLDELLQLIKQEGVPAPAPIEQRWTASSSSLLSPASSSNKDALFSWVGIIMYLPTNDPEEREAITKRFFNYREAAQKRLWDSYEAYEHWAKIEVPNDDESLQWLHNRLQGRFPVEAFNKARDQLDPHNILSNNVINKLFPKQ